MSVVCLLRVEAPLAAWLAWATPSLPSRQACSALRCPPQAPHPSPLQRVSSEGGSRLSCQINHAHLNLTGPAGC